MPILAKPDSTGQVDTGYKSFAAGSYVAKGIKWFTLDKEGIPIYVAQGDRLVARYRIVLENGEDGPPGSVDPSQISLLVYAFGGDVKKLPAPEDTARYLVAAEKLAVGKLVTVEVGPTGWVQRVPDMEVPEGFYIFKFAGVGTKNDLGEPSWREGQYGKFFVLISQVVCKGTGGPTPLAGAEVRDYVDYALECVEDASGEVGLEFVKGASGHYTAGAHRLSRIFSALTPDIYTASYEDSENILPEFVRMAQKGPTFMAYRGRSRGGRIFTDFNTIELAESGSQIKALPQADSADAVMRLGQVITEEVRKHSGNKGVEAFEGADVSAQMTPEGIAWAKGAQLKQTCIELQVPLHTKPPYFRDLERPHVVTLLRVLGYDTIADTLMSDF